MPYSLGHVLLYVCTWSLMKLSQVTGNPLLLASGIYKENDRSPLC